MAEASRTYEFNLDRFSPEDVFWRITDVRVDKPEIVALGAALAQAAPAVSAGRQTRHLGGGPSRPHVHRHAHRSIGNDGPPYVLGPRASSRWWAVLVDGLMATPDILDDVFIVNYLVKQGGGPSFLDGKVLLGSMNRSGLSNTVLRDG